MASTEAMRLFVKILEVSAKPTALVVIKDYYRKNLTFTFLEQEEDPGWYSRASNFVPEPVQDMEMNVSIFYAIYSFPCHLDIMDELLNYESFMI